MRSILPDTVCYAQFCRQMHRDGLFTCAATLTVLPVMMNTPNASNAIITDAILLRSHDMSVRAVLCQSGCMHRKLVYSQPLAGSSDGRRTGGTRRVIDYVKGMKLSFSGHCANVCFAHSSSIRYSLIRV